MGNCLRRESPTQWGGDDWGSPAPDEFLASNTRYSMEDKVTMMNLEEEIGLVGGKDRCIKDIVTSSSTKTTISSGKEVKIKISKKQLEEMLSRVDTKQWSAEQVLARLIDASDRCEEVHQRSWRPNLQSIPE